MTANEERELTSTNDSDSIEIGGKRYRVIEVWKLNVDSNGKIDFNDRRELLEPLDDPQ